MEVSIPAKYMIMRDRGVILEDDIVDDARLEAVDWAEKIRSSRLKDDRMSSAWSDVDELSFLFSL